MSEVIPAKAVEAATKAFRETHFMGDALMNALEAAAPHMLTGAAEVVAVEAMIKDAYDRGWGAGFRHHKEATK